jgi:hypothetical protein
VTEPAEVEHEHVHRWEGGDRRFRHTHRMPTSTEHPDATRPHRHVNGRHSHPHHHGAYQIGEPTHD